MSGRVDYGYTTEWAFYTFDIVIESENDVGGNIALAQVCLMNIDGTESHIWHGCGAQERREYRIDPQGRFTLHVRELDLRGIPGSVVPFDDYILKYWGTDDGGNPIYLEISFNYWDVF